MTVRFPAKETKQQSSPETINSAVAILALPGSLRIEK
jgi:hypothetical protein